MNQTTKIVALSCASFALGLLLRCENVPKTATKQTPIETRIQEKTVYVDKYIEIANDNKRKASQIKRIVSDLSNEITKAKVIHDTLVIVALQDSLIDVQKLEIKTLESVVYWQDKTILGKDGIIELKDIQIESLEIDSKEKDKQIKKFKRQKNLSIVGWVATSVGLILLTLNK
jgi:hypothetical protein